jgi:hypothetical protein
MSKGITYLLTYLLIFSLFINQLLVVFGIKENGLKMLHIRPDLQK